VARAASSVKAWFCNSSLSKYLVENQGGTSRYFEGLERELRILKYISPQFGKESFRMRASDLAGQPLLRRFRSAFGMSIALLGSLLALADTTMCQGNERKSWGYGFAAFGAAYEPGSGGEGTVHFGVGGEATLLKGFGPTVEIGYLTTVDGYGLGIFAPGVVYAFNRDRNTVPFVTAGYTLFFKASTAQGYFFGGGINHWIGDHWGIRVEGRDQVWHNQELHFLELRFAVVFR